MKDTRPFEGIIPEQVSDQTGLSILSCNAGFKRGEVIVILLQAAKSHFHEIADTAAEQFHVYQGPDQHMLFH